uniref:(California timema) hypothetical protein n=1 Tax=Timema californicum TaxID=61474 RepID=A0A7R9PAS8_TIMCA|nr:unnamed protein product [Timema californicum]
MYNMAADRGIYFELMYAPSIRDATARKNTISMAHMYHAYGKSKIRTSISPSSAVELNTTRALANSATEAGDIIEGKVEGRRVIQILDDLKERRKYRELKEEAED